MKACSLCNQEKSEASFRFRTDTNKYRPYCLDCEAKRLNKNYIDNKPHRLQKNQKFRSDLPIVKILRQAKETAKKKGLEFNITEEDIFLPEQCKYLNIPLTNTQGEGAVWSNYSIDRIDPCKGYIKGNVEIISRKANIMKSTATQEELITFAKNILKIFGV